MKRIVLIVLSMVLIPTIWAAESAVFREVKGKVEYQLEGEGWMPAKVGVKVPAGAMVSTGFKSTAALEVLGSIVMVKPLTRMVLDELVRTTGGTKTGLTLLSGKVKTEVKPSSATNNTEFDVKSPTATASVRGTGFEFDGENILVNHGAVEFANTWGVSRSIEGGEFSSAGRGASVSPPLPVKPAEKPILTATGGAEEINAIYGALEPEVPAAPAAAGGEGDAPAPAAGAAGDAPAEAAGEVPTEATGDPAPEAPVETAPEPVDTPAPEIEVDLGLSELIDLFGDDLIIDSGLINAIDEIAQIKDETLTEQAAKTQFTLSVDIR